MDSAKLPTVLLRRRTFLKRPARILGCLVTMTLCGPLARAAEVYAYLGPDYTFASGVYTTADHISGSFSTSVPLGPNLTNVSISPTDYSFGDGVLDWTSNNSAISEFVVTTDAYGTLTSATITLTAIILDAPWNILGISQGQLCLGAFVPTGGCAAGRPDAVFFEIPEVTAPYGVIEEGYVFGVGKWGPDFDPPAGVPEPATLLLTLPALLAVAIRVRRRIAPHLGRSMPVHHC